MKAILSLMTAMAVVAVHSTAAPFVNFTFDDPPLDPGALETVGGPAGVFRGTIGNVLPGWEAEYIGVSVTQVAYHVTGHQGTFVPITVHEYSSLEPISEVGGKHGLTLRVSSDELFRPDVADLVLRQRGEIPADAAGLWLFNGGHGEVRIDGQVVGKFSSAFSGPTFDISAYAGKEVTLEFAFYRGQIQMFDNLGFVSVPEPSTWALFGVGAALVFCIGRRKN